MTEDCRASLELVCTGKGSHKRRRLGRFVLDPFVPGVGQVFGLVTTPTAQHGRDGSVPSHLGVTRPDGGVTFRNRKCSNCGRDPQFTQESLTEAMEKAAELGLRALVIDVSTANIT